MAVYSHVSHMDNKKSGCDSNCKLASQLQAGNDVFRMG
jgi:hypothetical protein